jgi:hydrogenase nickel incorporation protein HypB
MDIKVFRDVLEHDAVFARKTRDDLRTTGTLCLNVIGAPGCGKTSFVRALVALSADRLRCGVIIGDITSQLDAERFAPLEIPVVQLNTGGACHLEARLARRGFESIDLADLDLVIVENVGNLACPAEFDLGEDIKISMVSVTEGHDKPSKYPLLFHHAGCHVLSKTDLAPFVDFDRAAYEAALKATGHDAPVFPVCAKSGDGLPEFLDWVVKQLDAKRTGMLPEPGFAIHAHAGGHEHPHRH